MLVFYLLAIAPTFAITTGKAAVALRAAAIAMLLSFYHLIQPDGAEVIRSFAPPQHRMREQAPRADAWAEAIRSAEIEVFGRASDCRMVALALGVLALAPPLTIRKEKADA